MLCRSHQRIYWILYWLLLPSYAQENYTVVALYQEDGCGADTTHARLRPKPGSKNGCISLAGVDYLSFLPRSIQLLYLGDGCTGKRMTSTDTSEILR